MPQKNSHALQSKMANMEMECLQVFRLADYQWYKDRVEERVAGTCEWFLKEANFQEWLERDSGPLLVSADPGCGKSVLAKFLVDTGLPRMATVCYFFFKDQIQNTAKQALCALLHQLFSQKPSLVRYAMSKFAENGDKLVNIPSVLWDILESATLDPEAGQVICVLDALDECAEEELKTLTERLNKHFLNINRGWRLKFLLTSRPYEYVVSPFWELEEKFPHIRIPGEEKSDDISREVDVVIKHRVNCLAKEKKLDPLIKEHLQMRLLEITHRTYLWVYLVFDYLRSFRFERTEDCIDSIVNNLPQTVEAAYESILKRAKDQKKARKALCIILAASRPLTLGEMKIALKITTTSKPIGSLRLEKDEDFKDTLREWCGLFIRVHAEKVDLIHQTARGFLTRKLPSVYPTVRPWHSISLSNGHAVLMEICLTYLIFIVLESDGWFVSSEQIHQHINGQAFLGYSAKYWAFHFQESKAQKIVFLKLISEIATNKDYLSRKLNVLSTTLGDYYQRTGIVDALSIAIGMAELAVFVIPKDHPESLGFLNTLGIHLGRRYERTGQVEDLNQAVVFANKAADTAPAAHPDRAAYLKSLGQWLGRRFERTGSISDLNRAVEVADMSVVTTPQDHPGRIGRLDSLGNLLGTRFERSGAIDDLNRAVEVAEMAVEATPQDHPNQAGQLKTLGYLLGRRFERRGAINDLNHAVEVAEMAVEATPQDHPGRAAILSNLGNLLGMRFKRAGLIDDLDRAVDIMNAAVDITPQDHPDRAGQLNGLGNLLGNRFELTGVVDDLNRAIDVTDIAVKATPQDHPNRAGQLNNLGNLLGKRFKQTSSMDDVNRALSSYREGWACRGASPSVRIHLAQNAARILAAQSNWDESSLLLQKAVQLLPMVTPQSLRHADKQHMLADFAGLASTAAAAALNAGRDACHALQLLELGRGVLADRLMQMRDDISNLKQMYPGLAEEFISLRDMLDSPGDELTSPNSNDNTFLWGLQAKRYEADQKFSKLIMRIRDQPGYDNFLLPPTSDDLMAAANPDPIIVVNLSSYRCDAFLITCHKIKVLELPALTLEQVRKRVSDLKLSRFDMMPLQEWLWNAVARPSLDALGFNGPPSNNNWPRIWWIPTGLLSWLPLHAAGRYARGSTDTVLDWVMSSYASSVKALLYGRRRRQDRIHDGSYGDALLVAVPQTPGISGSFLRYARDEVEILNDLCPLLQLHPIIPIPRKVDVLRRLRYCRIFHFAGHGKSDPTDPSRSCLVLNDWETSPLTVEDLRDQKLQENPPFLGYLSACSTGFNVSDTLLDEGIHLISACQLAGFRHVIGTLWEVMDEHCVDVARLFYETIRDEGMTDMAVCRGLHHAVRALRDSKTRSVANYYWAPYVHFGV